jgi:hypothetical protein
MAGERPPHLHQRCPDRHVRSRRDWAPIRTPMAQVTVVEEQAAPIQIEEWRNSADDAFLYLVSAFEALESFEASADIEEYSMSFELALGSVCTALVALDDYFDNGRQSIEQ